MASDVGKGFAFAFAFATDFAFADIIMVFSRMLDDFIVMMYNGFIGCSLVDFLDFLFAKMKTQAELLYIRLYPVDSRTV